MNLQGAGHTETVVPAQIQIRLCTVYYSYHKLTIYTGPLIKTRPARESLAGSVESGIRSREVQEQKAAMEWNMTVLLLRPLLLCTSSICRYFNDVLAEVEPSIETLW